MPRTTRIAELKSLEEELSNAVEQLRYFCLGRDRLELLDEVEGKPSPVAFLEQVYERVSDARTDLADCMFQLESVLARCEDAEEGEEASQIA